MALPIDLSERTLRWYAWFGRRALSEAKPGVRGSTISIGRLRSSKVTMRRVLLVPMVDTTVVIVLRRNSAAGRGGEVLRSHQGVGLRHELEKRQRLLAQPRGRNHVVGDTDVQWVAQRDRGASARIGETTEITRPCGCRGD